MGLIQKFKEWREYEKRAAQTLEEILLQSNVASDTITKKQALNIPSVAGCVNIISNTIAMLPILLYQETPGKVTEVKSDNRVRLLNDDTKDTLNAFQFKKQITEDYLLSGKGYAYINKQRNNIESLNYVDCVNVSINPNVDPIFKDYDVMCNGAKYRPFEFIKFTRKTKNGGDGIGIIEENNDALLVNYLTLQFERILLKTGGNKKGFIKAAKKLDGDSLTALKNAWNNLYRDNSENMMILNDGIDFKEVSNTSVEMQLNENKKTNSSEICKLFDMPEGLIEGKTTEQEYNNFIKICILPILKAFETELNRVLLLESEKDSFYFAFDIKELMKGDMLNRFKAYKFVVRKLCILIILIR